MQQTKDLLEALAFAMQCGLMMKFWIKSQKAPANLSPCLVQARLGKKHS